MATTNAIDAPEFEDRFVLRSGDATPPRITRKERDDATRRGLQEQQTGMPGVAPAAWCAAVAAIWAGVMAAVSMARR